MDVYSCRDFDEKIVRELVSERFETQRLRITDLTFSLEPDWEDDSAAGDVEAEAEAEAVVPA
jgi:hypothetical protein